MDIVHSFIDYIKDSQKELKKVSWPTREQTIRYSFIVILVSLALSAFLGGVDYLLSYLINTFVIK